MKEQPIDRSLAFTALTGHDPSPERVTALLADWYAQDYVRNMWDFAKAWIAEQPVRQAAREIAGEITEAARNSGDDPIAWVTGNSMFPPLRSFPAAEKIYQEDDGIDIEGTIVSRWEMLTELVEEYLDEAEVALECPEYDNVLYAVDLRRFEWDEDNAESAVTLQGEWKPREAATS